MSMFGASYLKGVFTPKHPEKCLNLNGKFPTTHKTITFRSSYELIFANFCDLEENVIEWGSEIIEIPYILSEDAKPHKYVTDFMLTVKTRSGEIEKWLIEVKPSTQVPKLDECGQIIFPQLKQGKKLTQKKIDNWQEMCNTLRKNKEKWDQAKRWAKQHGYVFKVITEQELGLNK